jgi:DNA replication protein DnaC
LSSSLDWRTFTTTPLSAERLKALEEKQAEEKRVREEKWRALEEKRRALEEEQRAKEAEKRKQELLKSVTEAGGARYHPDRVSLDNYEVQHKGQDIILARVRDLAARLPAAVRAGESIVFYGTPGTGKDHLLAALLHIATGQHGIGADWTSGPKLFARFRETMQRDGSSERWLLDHLAPPQVLAISDPVPPGVDLSGWEVNKLFAVVDARYQALRPTWITINARSEEEAKAKLTAQVWDRLIDRGHVWPCFWLSYRKVWVAGQEDPPDVKLDNRRYKSWSPY